MGLLFKFPGRQFLLRTAIVSASAGLLAGCTSDASRFAEGPFGPSDRTAVGTVANTGNALVPPASVGGGNYGARYNVASASPPQPSYSAPAIQSAPLPPPATAGANPRYSAPAATSPRLAAGTAAAGRPFPTATATPVSGAGAVAATRYGNWSPQGGTPITVGAGDSLSALSTRYGVPGEALLKVNGLHSASQIAPGTRLIVPVYSAGPSIGTHVRAASRPAEPPSRAAGRKLVEKKVAHAGDEGRKGREHLRLVKGAEAGKPLHDGKLPAKEARKIEHAKAAPQKKVEAAPVARVERKAVAQAVKPAPVEKVDPKPTGSLPKAEAPSIASNKPEFRWPARGRIIQGFRKGANDGINIALPEGTSVKAAESGVVAYAGSELKGYGNLVLIRHPNGFVSAYANNGDLKVKRGDTVHRGQIIATSGKTGNVASPQLHFELRKGSQPVNPTDFLAGL